MNDTRALVVVLLLLSTAPAHAEFKKAYFGATTPGSFAKMRSTDEKGAVSEYTYSRLADQGAEPWLELKYEAVSGQFKGTMSITGCLLPAGFALDRDAIDFQAHARRCAAFSTGSPVTEYAADTMKAIASGVINYAAIVTFKGTEMVDGKSCDRYGYVHKTNFGETRATMSGDLWMNDRVPFGLVKEASVTRDGSGKVMYKFENTLVASGDGARSGLPGWSWGRSSTGGARAAKAPPVEEAPATATTSLADAFARGILTIHGEVASSAKDGGRLRLRLTNRSREPLVLALTRTPVTLKVGAPLSTLTVAADADRVFEIAAGKTIPVEMNQKGKRRATRGAFTIGTYENKPFLQGSVEVGYAKAE